MLNKELAATLDQLADYYTVANDNIRARAFRGAARSIEVIGFEITKDKIDKIDFKNLGKSSQEIIKEFVVTGRVKRLQELQEQYPPIQALELLQLYNFDLQYILELWRTYRAYTIGDLQKLSDIRVQLGLARRTYTSKPLPEARAPFQVLGDLLVHTAYGQGRKTVSDTVLTLKERGHKHIFLADYYESSNVLGGLTESRVNDQQERIKEAQLEHNIRIWQGLIVDIDLQGNILCPSAVLAKVEFIILKISTSPHENLSGRMLLAVKQIPTGKPVLCCCVDRFCQSLERMKFIQLCQEQTILLTEADDAIRSFLARMPLQKVAIGTCSKQEQDYDKLDILSDLLVALNLDHTKIVNCFPRPFPGHVSYNSTVGVRTEPILPKLNQPIRSSNPMEKIEATLAKINELNSTTKTTSLGGLRGKKK